MMALGDCSLASLITSSRVKFRFLTCADEVNEKPDINKRRMNPMLYFFTA